MENAFSVSNEPSIIIRKQAILISAGLDFSCRAQLVVDNDDIELVAVTCRPAASYRAARCLPRVRARWSGQSAVDS